MSPFNWSTCERKVFCGLSQRTLDVHKIRPAPTCVLRQLLRSDTDALQIGADDVRKRINSSSFEVREALILAQLRQRPPQR